MDELLKSVYDLPDVSFIENDTMGAIMERLVSNYEKRYKEVTGKTVSLGAADPARIQLYAVALDLYQLEQFVDRTGKQDLLKYSYGEFLDHLGASRGVTRKQAAAATTTLRFTVSEPRSYVLAIPAGTRVTNGNGVYFRTIEYQEIKAGASFADVEADCTTEGTEGNGFLAGQINILVDPLPYIQSVENVTTTANGAAVEDDRSLAERIYLKPSSYSTAGPEDAYIYWAKTYNTNIGSVRPTTPEPGKAVIYILMDDGTLPVEETTEGLEEFLRDRNVRPMTDLVEVCAPTVSTFNVDLAYYVDRSNQAKAAAIQWQTTEIGKDINPDELIRRIREAGAKRVEITSPVYTKVGDTEVAQIGTKSVNYGGLEDD